ncbi:SAM-dependent methyltransferase [Streptomyces sp. NPDC002790]|uniref:class I SAM-dependent methyltransferase n=1 Tax=Streptomyces sp. NPDC002790 TaxID=3154431 RepID=UPI003327BB1D
MKREISVSTSRFDAVTQTARWTAAARARESRRTDRLFDDPLAELLAGEEGAALLKHFHTSRAADEGNPFLSIRTRWFDDFIEGAVTADRCQVVGLGAGLDTRAYRLEWPEHTVLFEADQPSLLSYKEQILDAHGASPRCDCRRLHLDLAGDWDSLLTNAGFDPELPTVWFAEGLLFYLPEELAHQVLSRAAALSAPGSVLAADLIGTGIFKMPYTQLFLRKLQDADSPWRFGTDDPAGFVENCGWRVTIATEPGLPGAQYGRWTPQAVPQGLTNLPRSFLVSAAKPSDS